jgi:hypothetical protein
VPPDLLEMFPQGRDQFGIQTLRPSRRRLQALNRRLDPRTRIR